MTTNRQHRQLRITATDRQTDRQLSESSARDVHKCASRNKTGFETARHDLRAHQMDDA